MSVCRRGPGGSHQLAKQPTRVISIVLGPLLAVQLISLPLIMSVSVDDLVASLSANHIGQEATDLAALQVCITPHALHGCLSRPLSRPSSRRPSSHTSCPFLLITLIALPSCTGSASTLLDVIRQMSSTALPLPPGRRLPPHSLGPSPFRITQTTLASGLPPLRGDRAPMIAGVTLKRWSKNAPWRT